MFDRERLQEIREEAMQESACSVNILWKRAFTQFANAADRLDAMIARTEDHISVESVIRN